jgi:hypothetical protein
MSDMKRLRVFGVLNHLGHQAEMLKLAKHYPVSFSYLENNVRRWSRFAHRPEPTTWLSPEEFEWVQSYEPGKYDVAILHLDQQAADPLIGKGQLYRQLNEIITDIPKIVINHGTPMWDNYDEETVINGGMVQTTRGPRMIDGIKQLVGDNFMIVNSYTAVERWGWGYPLIHGLEASEWYDLPKEPRVMISLSPGGLDKYYNRSLVTAIKGAVKERTGLDVIHTNVTYDPRDGEDYRQLVGSTLIHIYPFKDSPMPRSRTEAMLSGGCVLSSKYHDAAKFIENGVNGFIVPDNPLSYADAIHYLVNDCYRDAVDIGQKAKITAQKYFSLERYLGQLYSVLTEVAAGRKPEWDGKTIFEDVEEK